MNDQQKQEQRQQDLAIIIPHVRSAREEYGHYLTAVRYLNPYELDLFVEAALSRIDQLTQTIRNAGELLHSNIEFLAASHPFIADNLRVIETDLTEALPAPEAKTE